jgi:hypothetical protein
MRESIAKSTLEDYFSELEKHVLKSTLIMSHLSRGRPQEPGDRVHGRGRLESLPEAQAWHVQQATVPMTISCLLRWERSTP